MTALTPLDRAHTHPATLARTRERIGLITEAARRAGAYVAGAGSRGVAPTADAVAGLGAFGHPLPDSPRPAREVLAELDAFGSPATVVTGHGRHFGFVTGGTDPAAAAAAILAGAWDQNPGAFSPVAEALDRVACAWVVEALGLPSTAAASFNGGATVANLTGIIAARDALLARRGWDVGEQGLAGAPALRVVIGDEAHVSAVKALRLAGFGAVQIERVPTDASGAIDASCFPADTDDLTLVVLQAGNVDTGASDPFAAVIPGVRERGGWVHVDGAFGLWAAASPALRSRVAGVEGADSWATDGHKWLNLPYDSGIVVVRDPADLARAMRTDAAYLPSDPAALRGRGIQISQRARGVEAWAMLASHGREGLAALVEASCMHAALLARLLTEGGATLLAPVTLNQVLVSFGTHAATDAVVAAVQAEGTTWASGTVWHGTHAMRLSVSDAATTADDVAAAASAILECWAATRG
ncbi:pyridoxal-dependent decarboxylase [Demequina sp. NBRC 110057]|uniref:pyridoxal phosphate-dependent decarboxylase family protein n=1 Tax=Demequina sp. NBRC 110057 TaxID=1570346 RepID=UPI001356428B|nr:pyridoxal-dependent decarboxylase [Demequina sp. NBRC 110057]